MSRRLLGLARISSVLRQNFVHKTHQPLYLAKIPSYSEFVLTDSVFAPALVHSRLFNTSQILSSDSSNESSDSDDENKDEIDSDEFLQKYLDPKDRTRVISPELSIKYFESTAYKSTYGDDPIWKHYRRNYDGKKGYKGRPPVRTRETCIRQGKISTGSPCPVCRDEYIVIDYRHVALLNQFLDDYTGRVMEPYKTGICQKQWRKLQIALEKAHDYGLLDLDVPAVEYNMEEYKGNN
jgi:small subunit ribosomal protein S18b